MADAQLAPGNFYGRVVGKFNGQDLILSELKHAQARRLPSHTHELAYFSLLLSGAYSERLGQKTFDYHPMTIMFHPPGITHADEIGRNGGHFFSIEVQQRWLDRLRECAGTSEVPSELKEGELVWLATKLYREFRNLDSHSTLAIEGLILEMLAIAGRAQEQIEKRPPAWLSRVIEMLRAEYQQRLTLAEISSAVDIHPLHLSRVFRKFEGQSIGDFVNNLRLQFCCQELARPEADLAEIAIAAGFSDQSHFTRTFKKLTGFTPKTFRNTFRA